MTSFRTIFSTNSQDATKITGVPDTKTMASTRLSDGFERDPATDALLRKLLDEVEANLKNEQFGVEMLADKMGMSRSHLHRKLKQAAGKSVNQFIREYRLQRAMEFLRKEDMTVSEVAFAVGFGSASYFTACFTEHYGYPPGEAKRKINEREPTESFTAYRGEARSGRLRNKAWMFGAFGAIVLVLLVALISYQQLSQDDDRVVGPESFDRSIAVLPFRNLNASPESEYFSEGVVEAINRGLSGIADLRVVSLLSTDQYRDSNKSAGEIARELNVSNLLDGSIQRYENTVRIEVRLIDASNESQIWAENYDRELKDIFKTQSEIAEQVALALKATLSPEEKAGLNQRVTDNAAAYDLYLKGVYEYRTYTTSGNHRALDHFRQAIELDSGFALAYSGMAACYTLKASIFGAELDALEAMAMAKPLLDRALAIDPDLVDAHAWNGFYLLYNNWDFDGAEQEYKKAIASGHPDAMGLYSDLLNFTERHDEALAIAQKLNQFDPFYPGSRIVPALYYAGRSKEAADFARNRLKLLNNYLTLDSYGFLMLNTGNYKEAISIFQRGMEMGGIRYPRMLGWMGAAYAHSGQSEKANGIILELKAKRARTRAGSLAFFIAVIYSALGDKTSALSWLQEAYDSHEMEMPWLKSEPQFYPLHQEPGFQDLVKKMGFPG